MTESSPATRATTHNDAVCLTPLMLNHSAQTVMRVFFKNWRPSQAWRIRTGDCHEGAAFSCDRDEGILTFAQLDFASRDDLRCALIVQFALANSTASEDQLIRAVTIELNRCLKIARRLHHATLEKRLIALIQRTDDGGLTLAHDVDNDTILTLDAFAEPEQEERCEAWAKSVARTSSQDVYEDPLMAAALAAALDRERRQTEAASAA